DTFLFFFFFSSRRRHTRFSRDWSSDVCSSDLAVGADVLAELDRLGVIGRPGGGRPDRAGAEGRERGEAADRQPGIAKKGAPVEGGGGDPLGKGGKAGLRGGAGFALDEHGMDLSNDWFRSSASRVHFPCSAPSSAPRPWSPPAPCRQRRAQRVPRPPSGWPAPRESRDVRPMSCPTIPCVHHQ